MATVTSKMREKALGVLGLSAGARADAIRRAYRSRARSCHPDLHGGRPDMERRFQELNEAYRTLLECAEPPEFSSTNGGERAAPRRGGDLRFRFPVDFLTAARGGEVPVRLSRPAPCPVCSGRRGPACLACSGKGEVMRRAVLRVKVPSGVEENEVLRLAGGGGAGRFGGPAGDLYLVVACGGHPEFVRYGLDVCGEVRVPRARFERGGSVRVKTIHGESDLRLPPGTRPGKIFQLHGLGVVRRGEGGEEIGDHFVRLTREAEGPGG